MFAFIAGRSAFITQLECRLRPDCSALVAHDRTNPNATVSRAKARSGIPAPAAHWAAILVAVAALLELAGSGFALEPSKNLASYGRQTWVMENGLPQKTV